MKQWIIPTYKESVLYLVGLFLFITILDYITYYYLKAKIDIPILTFLIEYRFFWFGSLIIATFIVGKKYIKHHTFKIKNSWYQTTKAGLYAVSLSFLVTSLSSTLLNKFGNGIPNSDFEMKGLSELFTRLSLYPFNVVAEEFWRLLTFLALLSFMSFIKNEKVRIMAVILLSSLWFGALHLGYSLEYGLVIFLNTIPVMVIFAIYRSIIPLIIFHLFNNVISTIAQYDSSGEKVMIGIMLVILIYVAIDLFIIGIKDLLKSIKEIKAAIKKNKTVSK